jgi:hypothetical protein
MIAFVSAVASFERPKKGGYTEDSEVRSVWQFSASLHFGEAQKTHPRLFPERQSVILVSDLVGGKAEWMRRQPGAVPMHCPKCCGAQKVSADTIEPKPFVPQRFPTLAKSRCR